MTRRCVHICTLVAVLLAVLPLSCDRMGIGRSRAPAPVSQPAPPPSGDVLAGAPAYVMHEKIDPTLRRRLAEVERRGGAEKVPVLVRVNFAMEGEPLDRLHEAGFEIRTLSGDLVTVRGTPDAVRRALDYRFVVRMSLGPAR